MSASNVAALETLFAPPAPPAGAPSTSDLQKMQSLALVTAKLAEYYAMTELPLIQAQQQQIDAQININPATASDALRTEQEALQAEAQSLQNVLDGQYTNYTDGVNAWYSNMTSGSPYQSIDTWRETTPSSYPDLFAARAKVTF